MRKKNGSERERERELYQINEKENGFRDRERAGESFNRKNEKEKWVQRERELYQINKWVRRKKVRELYQINKWVQRKKERERESFIR